MKQYQFTKKDGQAPTEGVIAFLRGAIPKLNDGFWEVRIQKPKRTADENSLFWFWCSMVSEETGQDKQAVYQYFCQMFIPDHCSYRQNSDFVSGGTSELNTKEFATFLTEIKAHVASELGITLPTREDANFNEFYSQYCK